MIQTRPCSRFYHIWSNLTRNLWCFRRGIHSRRCDDPFITLHGGDDDCHIIIALLSLLTKYPRIKMLSKKRLEETTSYFFGTLEGHNEILVLAVSGL